LKAFSFLDKNGKIQIGLRYREKDYNFSLAWEIYKNLKNSGRGPSLDFLQVMVEVDFLHAETFAEVFDALQEVRSMDDLQISGEIDFLPPIGRPQKIIGVGRNYRAHAKELGNVAPDEPIFFSKAISALLGHNGEIKLPAESRRVDFEGEVALVIGKRSHRISERMAEEHIAGYTLLNDVTARDLQKEDQKNGRPWFRSKSFDSFCPVGPYLIPKETLKDPENLELTVYLNGELKQQAKLSDMLFSFTQLVSYISRTCTLEPGDIIATGTPAGVGQLNPNDCVEVKVEEIGTLKNKVIR